MLCNKTSRYDVASIAVRGGAMVNPKVAVDAHILESRFKHLAQKDREYIYTEGRGMLNVWFSAKYL